MTNAKKLTRLYFDFERSGTFIENGVCAIDVYDPEDEAEVSGKIDNDDFTFFRVLSREYDDVEGTFDEFEES